MEASTYASVSTSVIESTTALDSNNEIGSTKRPLECGDNDSKRHKKK